MENQLKRLSNTRKHAVVPKGTATIEQAKKIVKHAPMSTKETLNRLEKLGLAGGRRKTRRRHTRKHRR